MVNIHQNSKEVDHVHQIDIDKPDKIITTEKVIWYCKTCGKEIKSFLTFKEKLIRTKDDIVLYFEYEILAEFYKNFVCNIIGHKRYVFNNTQISDGINLVICNRCKRLNFIEKSDNNYTNLIWDD
jgi:hypothetical protein